VTNNASPEHREPAAHNPNNHPVDAFFGRTVAQTELTSRMNQGSASQSEPVSTSNEHSSLPSPFPDDFVIPPALANAGFHISTNANNEFVLTNRPRNREEYDAIISDTRDSYLHNEVYRAMVDSRQPRGMPQSDLKACRTWLLDEAKCSS